MANEMSGEQMQARIAAARRDAESLKDKIKRKKDELADTNREFSPRPSPSPSSSDMAIRNDHWEAFLDTPQIWLN